MSDAARKTVELPALCVRAAITPASIDTEQRTIDVDFSTGAAVRRFDWMKGEAYIEKLSMKPEHVRLDRLNSRAPVLDTHDTFSGLKSQLGVVQPDSAKMTGRKGVATLRFSKRADVEPIWRDIEDGIIANVSVGYLVHRYEETPAKKGEVPTRLAVDWEPYEVSMVPMPADVGAQTRDGQPAAGTLHPCVIDLIERSLEETAHMDPVTAPPESIVVERNPNDPGAPIDPVPALRIIPAEPNARDLGVTAERERVQGIRRACLASKMTREFEEKLVASGKSLEACQTDVFTELDRRGYGDVGPQNPVVRERALDGDPNIHQTEGIKEAILHRMDPAGFPLTDKGRVYRGLTMIDIAKLHLQARGMRVTDMTKNEIAATALGMRGVGMHSTSDFPYLLADVAVKSLRKAYDEAPQTWMPMARPVTLTNYRATSITQLGDAPELLEVLEHGEYKSGTMGEGREQIQLRKYGRKFGITREAMINDDLGAFSRVPANFGRKARAKQSDLVWEQITSNPLMGDGFALFSINHNNLATTDAAIDITSLGLARTALRQQRSLDGEYLNIAGRFLIVPPGQETLAEQYVSVIQPQVGTNVNPFAGKLTVVTDPRLTDEDEWYVATGPEFEWLIYGYLEGEEGPQVDTRNGFDIDGLEIKCRLDFAAKVIDWRGIYKNEGNT